jgi:hypothetical protein
MPILLTLIALLFSKYATADFIPGRVRASAEAREMRVTEASGIFQGAREASMVEYTTDGRGITHYRLLINGDTFQFLVRAERSLPCEAVVHGSSRPSRSHMTLRDHSRYRADCRFGRRSFWQAEIKSGGSRLKISGVPEHFILTM